MLRISYQHEHLLVFSFCFKSTIGLSWWHFFSSVLLRPWCFLWLSWYLFDTGPSRWSFTITCGRTIHNTRYAMQLLFSRDIFGGKIFIQFNIIMSSKNSYKSTLDFWNLFLNVAGLSNFVYLLFLNCAWLMTKHSITLSPVLAMICLASISKAWGNKMVKI